MFFPSLLAGGFLCGGFEPQPRNDECFEPTAEFVLVTSDGRTERDLLRVSIESRAPSSLNDARRTGHSAFACTSKPDSGPYLTAMENRSFHAWFGGLVVPDHQHGTFVLGRFP